jgi:hypothetical protein
MRPFHSTFVVAADERYLWWLHVAAIVRDRASEIVLWHTIDEHLLKIYEAFEFLLRRNIRFPTTIAVPTSMNVSRGAVDEAVAVRSKQCEGLLGSYLSRSKLPRRSMWLREPHSPRLDLGRREQTLRSVTRTAIRSTVSLKGRTAKFLGPICMPWTTDGNCPRLMGFLEYHLPDMSILFQDVRAVLRTLRCAPLRASGSGCDVGPKR